MKRYNAIQGLILSFFSPALYRDVARNWGGIAFSYLFLLLVICTIPLSYKTYLAMGEISMDYVNQFPAMQFSNGQLSIDKPTPYFIKTPDNEVIAIIDTTGQYTSLDNTKATVLFTKTKAIFKNDDKHETRIYDYKSIKNLTITHEQIIKFVNQVKLWGAIVLYPFFLIFLLIYRLILALLYAAVGMLLAAIGKVKLTYQQMLRITIVSFTPTIIAGAFFSHYIHSLVVYFLITLVYLVFAIYSNSKNEMDQNITTAV